MLIKLMKRRIAGLAGVVIPLGTRRRYYFELGRSGISIIRAEGFRNFWLRAKPFISSWLPGGAAYRYKAWIDRSEPDAVALEQQRKQSVAFKYRPKISVVTPVWNTGERWLRLAVESVMRQSYDNWELCVVDGGSTKSHVRVVLEEYAQKDPRIKVKLLPENKGISENSNEALSLATGDFIALLDHDDELAPFALYECAKILNEKPATDFMYSDEDKMARRNKRFEPFFKPDWSPDRLLSQMYTCHLSVYRKAVVDRIGGFRPEYDGSQDYDLALRFVEKTQNIEHIPKVLYHWRLSVQSAASGSAAKPYAFVAGRKALSDYLARNSIEGEAVDGRRLGLYRVRRRILGEPLVSIVVASKDRAQLLRNCVGSILEKTDHGLYEILIVDNGSSEPATLQYYGEIAANPRIRVLHYDGPFSYSALNNWAARQAKGEHLLLISDHAEVISAEWLTAMLEQSQRPEVGPVGAKLLFPDGTIQQCGMAFSPVASGIIGLVLYRRPDSGSDFGRADTIANCTAVSGACMMIKKCLYEQLGGLDENLSFNYADADMCLKAIEKGYLVVYTPYSSLHHLESEAKRYPKKSGRKCNPSKDAEYFMAKWGKFVERGDRYYAQMR